MGLAEVGVGVLSNLVKEAEEAERAAEFANWEFDSMIEKQ